MRKTAARTAFLCVNGTLRMGSILGRSYHLRDDALARVGVSVGRWRKVQGKFKHTPEAVLSWILQTSKLATPLK